MPERKKKDPKSKRKVAEAEAASAAGQAEEADSEPDAQGETAQGETAPRGTAPAEAAPAEAAPDESVAAEADRAAGLEVEVASLKDQLLRALAETENLRRRSQREREDAVKYAAAPLIKDLVGVVDNLRRAMHSVSTEALEDDEHLKTLMTGLEMTEKELNAVFEKHHIVKIEPLGERLDPHYHEAMYEIPDPEATSGTVLQVLQPGYRLHGRLLRPAQVGVAAGGPAPAREAEAAAEDADDAETGDSGPAPEPPAEPEVDPEPAGGNGEVPPGSTVDTTA